MDGSKSNIVSSPIGWATKVVGTQIRYVYFQFLTLVIGLLCSRSYYTDAILVHSIDSVRRITFFIFFCSCLLPLCYLRAMRSLYIAISQKTPNT